MSDGTIVALEEISRDLVQAEKDKKEAEARREDLRKKFFDLATAFVGPDSRYSYDVAATGRRLQRSVAFGSPAVNYDLLRELLGPELFERVVKAVVVTTYEIDYQAFLEAVNREEITKAQIDKAVTPGRVTCRLLHSKIKTGETSPEEEEKPDPLNELILKW